MVPLGFKDELDCNFNSRFVIDRHAIYTFPEILHNGGGHVNPSLNPWIHYCTQRTHRQTSEAGVPKNEHTSFKNITDHKVCLIR